MALTDMIHYKTMYAVLERLHCIPPAVLSEIKAKPATSDRAADSAWRRVCAAWNIDTSPLKETKTNRVGYDRMRYLTERVGALEKDLGAALETIRDLEGRLAKAEAMNDFYRTHPRAAGEAGSVKGP